MTPFCPSTVNVCSVWGRGRGREREGEGGEGRERERGVEIVNYSVNSPSIYYIMYEPDTITAVETHTSSVRKQRFYGILHISITAIVSVSG